jgi:serine/threonine-protein kinase
LWSERDEEKARQALTQSLYHARKALSQDDLFFATADLRLNDAVIGTDLDDFSEALDRGDLNAAVALYHGPFLDGFHLTDAPEFERWMTEQRSSYHGRVVRAFEQLASEATGRSDFATAAERWRQLAALEPLNSRIAVELMRALARAGDRAGAIRYAEIHEMLIRDQLDVAPHPAISALADDLRAQPVWMPPPPDASAAIPAHAERDLAPPNNDPATDIRVHRGRFGSRWRIATPLAAVLVFAIAATVWWWKARPAAPPADTMLVVAPFRVSGADASIAYLREGLVDLMVTSLSDDRSGVADPGAVLTAWRRAGFTDGVDPPRERTIDLARRLGGTRLITGSVVGGPNHLVVNAAIIGVATGTVRVQASADGPADSLTMIVDRLVARLLVKDAGEWERVASHTSSSPRALRAYLDGQVAYRRARYNDAVRSFRRALELDSSFALAGLGLATAAERIDANDDDARGLAAAWNARAELTARDAAYLNALAGPNYPGESSIRDHLVAWEHATTVLSDRADAWHELGERLFYDGQSLGFRDWSVRATAAFRRATALAPTFASPLQYLVQLSAHAGDSAQTRTMAATYLALDSSGGELAPFVRWRTAVALGDRVALRTLRGQMSNMPAASLRLIALSGQYNAISLPDAQRAISVLWSRVARGAERADVLLARHALALNRGARAQAVDASRLLADDRSHRAFAARLQVTDYLYGGGDSLLAAQSAEQLRKRVTTVPTDSRSGSILSRSAEDASNACVVRQWRAWLNATSGTDSAATLLLHNASTDDTTGSALCSALADAIEAASGATADAVQRAARADSLIAHGATDDEVRDYVGLALARVWLALGDDRRALEAVRRRPYMRRWPHYLAAHLELEGRIAASLGDSVAAVAAYERYVELRGDTETGASAEIDAIRDAIARLSAGTAAAR